MTVTLNIYRESNGTKLVLVCGKARQYGPCVSIKAQPNNQFCKTLMVYEDGNGVASAIVHTEAADAAPNPTKAVGPCPVMDQLILDVHHADSEAGLLEKTIAALRDPANPWPDGFRDKLEAALATAE